MSNHKNEATTRSLLVLELEGTDYAFPSENVLEVMAMQEISPLPRQPKPFMGILNYKGKIVPVVSFSELCKGEENIVTTLVLLSSEENGIIAVGTDDSIRIEQEAQSNMECDLSVVDQRLIKFEGISNSKTALFIVDVRKTMEALREYMEEL